MKNQEINKKIYSIILIGLLNLIPFIYFLHKCWGLKGDLQLGMYVFGILWVLSILVGLLILGVNIQNWKEKKISNNVKIFAFPTLLLFITIINNLYDWEFLVYVFVNFISYSVIRFLVLKPKEII